MTPKPKYRTQGQLLRRYRLARTPTTSQQDVADAIGVSQGAVSQWETGDSKPEPDKVRALDDFYGTRGVIAEAYGVSLPREGTAVTELTRQVAALRAELDARGRLLDDVLARLERLEAD